MGGWGGWFPNPSKNPQNRLFFRSCPSRERPVCPAQLHRQDQGDRKRTICPTWLPLSQGDTQNNLPIIICLPHSDYELNLAVHLLELWVAALDLVVSEFLRSISVPRSTMEHPVLVLPSGIYSSNCHLKPLASQDSKNREPRNSNQGSQWHSDRSESEAGVCTRRSWWCGWRSAQQWGLFLFLSTYDICGFQAN